MMGELTHTQIFTFVGALMTVGIMFAFAMSISWWHERQARKRHAH